MCENLVVVTLAIGKLHHIEFLKPSFLHPLKWAISLVSGHIYYESDVKSKVARLMEL